MGKTKPDTDIDDQPYRHARVVRLPTGGTLGFTLDVNLLKCGPEDRAFLFGIIDALDAYEKACDVRAAAKKGA